MTPDYLRARIATALATTSAADFAGSGLPMSQHGSGHTYHGGCALCRGEIDTLVDAVMAVFEAVLNACRWCKRPAGDAHPPACPHYVGPVQHETTDVTTVGGGADVRNRCSCGTFWYRSATEQCPSVAEVWRGSMPWREDVR